MKKTGIFGGTFDPVHNAHLMIAQKAREQFGLDKVLFMPTPNPPHKDKNEITPVDDRVNMILCALQNQEGLEFSDFELCQTNDVYTANTLVQYHQLHPEEELYFIIGGDSLYSLDSWYHPEIIFSHAHILVAKRDDASATNFQNKICFLRETFQANISVLDVGMSDISSSKIRESLANGCGSDVIPETVMNYITTHQLYQNQNYTKKLTNAEIIEDLKKILKPSRFTHTLGVAETAKKMAQVLGENPNKAYLAGLLHDCAKCIPDKEKIMLCELNNIPITASEYANPSLLHAKLGAYYAKTKYFVTDESILQAIRYHTTGKEDMTLLEKIIFTADYIEPGRDKAPHLDKLRKEAFRDIDWTVYRILKDTLQYLKKKNLKNTDEFTQAAFEYYRKLHDGGIIMDIKEIAKVAYNALDDKKGINITALDISEVSVMADYFIIASGNNENQVRAMVDSVDEEMRKIGKTPTHIEGYRGANWVLMDYEDIIIHVFNQEDRLFYDLERIWRDGKIIEL